MAKRYPNPRLIKIHWPYTPAEAAEALGIHVNTVRNWLKDGLCLLEDKRPYLIHGTELRRFLGEKRKAGKKPLKSHEFYCLRCRDAVRSIDEYAEITEISSGSALISGICDQCGSMLNRRYSLKNPHLLDGFDLSAPKSLERLIRGSYPFLNCDFN